MIFNDEFQSTAIDSSKWVNGYYWGANDGNMGNSLLSNSVDDGEILHLKTAGTLASHTVSALTTKQTFQTGYFEARMKLAKGQGSWPAFWLLYDPGTTGLHETDIIEYLGNHNNYYYSTIHIAGSSSQPQWQYQSGLDLSADYHLYGVNITATTIEFYFDGNKFFTTPYPASDPPGLLSPQKLTLNQGIMCGTVNWDNNLCDVTSFSPLPETLVDWVRVWTPTTASPTASPTPTPTPSPSPTPAPKVGDFNHDGLVNDTDYSVWLTNFQKGTMTGIDYVLWLNNYGK
jgi:hypothetical protein